MDIGNIWAVQTARDYEIVAQGEGNLVEQKIRAFVRTQELLEKMSESFLQACGEVTRKFIEEVEAYDRWENNFISSSSSSESWESAALEAQRYEEAEALMVKTQEEFFAKMSAEEKRALFSQVGVRKLAVIMKMNERRDCIERILSLEKELYLADELLECLDEWLEKNHE